MHNLIACILTLKKNVAVVEWVFTINNVGVKLHSKKVAEISILKEVLKISHLINNFLIQLFCYTHLLAIGRTKGMI